MKWEEEIGIGAYLTDYRCEGVIKEEPEDFVVEEEGELGRARVLLLRGRKAPLEPEGDGEYLYVVLEKRDWDLNDVLRVVARRLHVGRDRISFAGTKDKYALTAQWISLWRVRWRDLKALHIRDVAFHTPVYRGKKLRRGDLLGNWFQVRVRGCRPEPPTDLFLNYFGPQRFGSYRFVSHLVGRALLKGDFEAAVWEYLTHTSPWEPEETRRARERLKREGDFKEALNYFPRRLRKERTILEGLAAGKDFKSAILSLPKNLISLFLHAYQAYLFNRALTLKAREEGVKEGEMGSVVGFRVGPSNPYEEAVLEEEGVSTLDFRRWRRFGTEGERRPLLERALNLSVEDQTLRFFLRKGVYATSFLREILKPSSPAGFVFSRKKLGDGGRGNGEEGRKGL